MLAQPVNDSSADAQAGGDFANGHEPLVRAEIGRLPAHHRRTIRRLNVSVFCYGIRIGPLRVPCHFRRLQRRTSRRHAVGFLLGPFGTRGSQVQILSPRPTNYAVGIRGDGTAVSTVGRTTLNKLTVVRSGVSIPIGPQGASASSSAAEMRDWSGGGSSIL